MTVGQVQVPFAMIVMPKLLPLPFGRAVTLPLVPLTATFRLNRSPHCWPADSTAVQLLPPGSVGVGVGPGPPPSQTVMSENEKK